MKLSVLEVITRTPLPVSPPKGGTAGTEGTSRKIEEAARPVDVPEPLPARDISLTPNSAASGACPMAAKELGQAGDARLSEKQDLSRVSRLSQVQDDLSHNDTEENRRRCMAKAWADAYHRLGAFEYPTGGRDILAGSRPDLLTAWNQLEARAEKVSCAFVANAATRSELLSALTVWETAVVRAIAHLGQMPAAEKGKE